jgi:hypothetical protein
MSNENKGEVIAHSVTLRLRLAANWMQSIQILREVELKLIPSVPFEDPACLLATCPSG